MRECRGYSWQLWRSYETEKFPRKTEEGIAFAENGAFADQGL